MIAGMFVVHEGQAWQVTRISGFAQNWAGLPNGPTTYRLNLANDPTVGKYLTDPSSAELGDLTPACSCGARPGYCAADLAPNRGHYYDPPKADTVPIVLPSGAPHPR